MTVPPPNANLTGSTIGSGTNAANRVGWRSYLGVEPGGAQVPGGAVPARRADLSGLPPTFIAVGDIELFYEEDVEYARRLREAGVEVTLDIMPGAPHGFENWVGSSDPARSPPHQGRPDLAWIGAHEEGVRVSLNG